MARVYYSVFRVGNDGSFEKGKTGTPIELTEAFKSQVVKSIHFEYKLLHDERLKY